MAAVTWQHLAGWCESEPWVLVLPFNCFMTLDMWPAVLFSLCVWNKMMRVYFLTQTSGYEDHLVPILHFGCSSLFPLEDHTLLCLFAKKRLALFNHMPHHCPVTLNPTISSISNILNIHSHRGWLKNFLDKGL